MKKAILLLIVVMLWASPASAQQAGGTKAPVVQAAERLEEFDAGIGLLYKSLTREGSTRASEYEFEKSGAGGILNLEWDPLPHRFVAEGVFLNQKDYFGEMDYAFSDIIVFNMFTRGLYHNMRTQGFGTDDPLTVQPSSVDRNPGEAYGVGTQINRGFVRFKTPDFPFHIYADVRTVDKEGVIQQRFMRGYTGGLSRASQARDIDRNTQDVTVGSNVHLGPVEADFSHNEKKYRELDDKALFDPYTTPALNVAHNSDPSLKQRSNTIKLHSTLTGRIAMAGTYTDGMKRNLDSATSSNYHNTAADLTLIPIPNLMMAAKYRHFDISMNNPENVSVLSPAATYNVRDAISSKRDIITGFIRYRFTPRFFVRGEYVFDTTLRDVSNSSGLNPLQTAPTSAGTGPDSWNAATRTTKGTGRIGMTYAATNKVIARADYSLTQVTNPAYTMDPDRIDAAKASVTWMPLKPVTLLLSYSGKREKRDNLSAPLAGGSRKAARDQAVASLTLVTGKRSSITVSYSYYAFKNRETLTYQDITGSFLTEDGVPYADKTNVASVSAGYALSDALHLTAEASKGISRGRFRNDGTVANTNGIAEFSDLRLTEDTYGAGAELQVTRRSTVELRFTQNHFKDEIDSSQNSTVRTVLGTVAAKW